jgi:hypothetical protein
MLKLKEYRDFDLCDFGFWGVLVFDLFLLFGLGEGVGLMDEDLGLRMEENEG